MTSQWTRLLLCASLAGALGAGCGGDNPVAATDSGLRDAGPTDGGLQPDSSSDAGNTPTPDSGSDGGQMPGDAGTDGGPVADAGVDARASDDAGVDAASAGDAGADAGSAGDAGNDAGPSDAGMDGGRMDIPSHVVTLVNEIANGMTPAGFPLAPGADEQNARSIPGLTPSVVASWLDPITMANGGADPRFGQHNDYTAYFGDGWNVGGAPPQWHGDPDSGWFWVNHEYMSSETRSGGFTPVNALPTLTTPPFGMHLTLSQFLVDYGQMVDVLDAMNTQAELDTYNMWTRRQVGGSWVHISRDNMGRWSVDRAGSMGQPNRRYDATDSTLVRITGIDPITANDHLDGSAMPLQPGLSDVVAVGTLSNCSGGTTPWGTILTAEENTDFNWGDLESCWDNARLRDQRAMVMSGTDAGAPGMLVVPDTSTCRPGRRLNDPGTVMVTAMGMSFTVGAGILSPANAAAGGSAAAFAQHSDPNFRHNRDLYSYLVEIDPGAPADQFYDPATGEGHRKLGDFGRAHWENATFAVDEDWELINGQPIVVYMGDDRRSGRIFRWVSTASYTTGMTRQQIRAMLDDGTLYVGQFESMAANGYELIGGGGGSAMMPGMGRWVRLSTTSSDIAPNAMALGDPTRTVGNALTDNNWNHLGGFEDDDEVRLALFTACMKIGVRELNRPEDIEWNPRDPSGVPTLYVAFTNNNRVRGLNLGGEYVVDPDMSVSDRDSDGSIWAIREQLPGDLRNSGTFTFWRVWRGGFAQLGTGGTGIVDTYEAANPDNLLIDGYGHVWFGTDGAWSRSGSRTSDAVYYLDLDPAHRTTPTPTYGRAFRVVAMPSDAETTGPSFNSDMTSLFVAVQHPGEGAPYMGTPPVSSQWPNRPLVDMTMPMRTYLPRSGVLALTIN